MNISSSISKINYEDFCIKDSWYFFLQEISGIYYVGKYMLCVATSTFIIYSYYSSNHDHYDIDGRLASLFTSHLCPRKDQGNFLS